MDKPNTVLLSLAVIAIAAASAACSSSSKGAEVFRREKCMDCHTLKGEGGAVGPNLTRVGSKRSRDYIIQQIKDPKTHNPNTEMPSYGSRIPEQDINALADYLSGLK
jgi:mono/diheme cytochrome c family protein